MLYYTTIITIYHLPYRPGYTTAQYSAVVNSPGSL